MAPLEKEKLKEKLEKLAVNGKIACPVALKAANEADVSPRVIGELCNEMKIKIQGCQLGCFP